MLAFIRSIGATLLALSLLGCPMEPGFSDGLGQLEDDPDGFHGPYVLGAVSKPYAWGPNETFRMTSSDPSVIRVVRDGGDLVLTAMAVGTATLTARLGGDVLGVSTIEVVAPDHVEAIYTGAWETVGRELHVVVPSPQELELVVTAMGGDQRLHGMPVGALVGSGVRLDGGGRSVHWTFRGSWPSVTGRTPLRLVTEAFDLPAFTIVLHDAGEPGTTWTCDLDDAGAKVGEVREARMIPRLADGTRVFGVHAHCVRSDWPDDGCPYRYGQGGPTVVEFGYGDVAASCTLPGALLPPPSVYRAAAGAGSARR